MPSKKQSKIRREFLVAFTKALIKNSAPAGLAEIKKEPSPENIIETSPPLLKIPPKSIPSPMKLPAFARRMKIAQPRVQPPMVQIPPQQPSQSIQGRIYLGKVAQFLKDPSVLSVECTGPGKNLLINRSGAIQTTPAALSKEEIDRILNEISTQTQIPIVPGLFKALFKNLLITAVVSDYVGSRFIIQKRTPF